MLCPSVCFRVSLLVSNCSTNPLLWNIFVYHSHQIEYYSLLINITNDVYHSSLILLLLSLPLLPLRFPYRVPPVRSQENTNKAVIADLFVSTPDQSTAAFASVAFSNGLAGALAFFAYPSLNRITMASLVFAFSVKAVLCYYASVYYNTGGKESAYRRAVIWVH